jgi:P4 family phage/plasmid primase-like protien
MEALQTFVNVVHRYTPDDALISLCRLFQGHMTAKWYLGKFRETLLQEHIKANPNINTYLRITPVSKQPERGRGLEADSMGASVLWLDYDCYSSQLEGFNRLKALPKPPTLIVNSGKGLQAYWLLDRFCTDLRAIKARNKKIAKEIDPTAGDSCFDLARVLRAPDTFNMKDPERPVLCTILSYDPTLIYTLEDFEEAPLTETSVMVWDPEPIEADTFTERLQEQDKKLYSRILSEDLARKAGAPITDTGEIDRSKNDFYITNRLLQLGYEAAIILSVLTHPAWLSGMKYRRYDYVVTTVNSALQVYETSEDQFFGAKNAFQPTRMAKKVLGDRQFLYANEQLYRYESGYFQPNGVEWIREEVAKRLGKRWNSRYSSETVTYIVDTNRVPPEELNNHDGLINVSNGMIDLKTGELKPHSPHYLSLHQIPISYDPKATAPDLDAFVAAILPEDAIPVFWEYVGSALLQRIYWPKAFMALVGPGNTGKSKLLEWVYTFYGAMQNCTAIDLQTLADNRFAMANLFGRIANIFSDLNEAEAKNTGQIKALTGDDVVAGEKKGKDHFFFKNTARLFFSANHFPSVRAPDGPFFDRAIIVPCVKKFTSGKAGARTADKDIIAKLSSPVHFSAGLNRALEGLRRLQAQNGFSHSESIAEANQAFRFAADNVAGFLHQCIPDPHYKLTKQAFYQQYRMLCEQGGKRPFSDDKFFKRVSDIAEQFELGEEFLTNPDKSRSWYFVGLRPPSTLFTSAILEMHANGRASDRN